MTQSGPGRARLIVAGLMALTGALFFYEFLVDDLGNLTEEGRAAVPLSLKLRYVLAMAAGGALAGAVTAGLFGRSGATGWAVAALGAILASALAGLFGSTLGLLPDLPADGVGMRTLVQVGFGLVLIPLSFAGRPYLFGAWLVLVVATHLWARSARRTG